MREKRARAACGRLQGDHSTPFRAIRFRSFHLLSVLLWLGWWGCMGALVWLSPATVSSTTSSDWLANKDATAAGSTLMYRLWHTRTSWRNSPTAFSNSSHTGHNEIDVSRLKNHLHGLLHGL